MTFVMASGGDLTPILVALLGGGFISGLVALLKYKPEKDQVVVSAAQGAVVVQSGVIDALQEELKRRTDELATERAERIIAEQNADKLRDQVKRAGMTPEV